VLHFYETRKERIPEYRIRTRFVLRFKIQALADLLRSNKIAVLNVAGSRESNEPGVYEWTLNMLRFFLSRTVSVAGSADAARE
jgi:hypothetical protein